MSSISTNASSIDLEECLHKRRYTQKHAAYSLHMALLIKQLRLERGMNQEMLAAKAGMSRSQLSEIESGKKPANTLRLAAIAKALGVDEKDLFSPGAESAYESEIHQLMKRMSDDDREALLHMARAFARPT
jgi:transcriptional regulator with XRE-family HTH domain